MRQPIGNDLVLGLHPGSTEPIELSAEQRKKHLYVCGLSGSGKSKFLENLIQQDILSWRKSKCGMLVIDPHGELYDNITSWLAVHNLDRPIIPIDLRCDDWVVSYNLLRQRESADPAVLVDNITGAIAHVWGQGGTKQTPLFARWAANVLRALYEKKLTLVEAQYLLDHVSKHIRFALTSDLTDEQVRQDWQFADTLSAKDFETQIGSTVNRLRAFIKNQTLRRIFGQPKASLDFGTALEQGAIILVSLATEHAKVSPDDAELFATLLLSDLWTAAQDRGKRKVVKPFYVYLDEFQKFVTPTISENLDQARGFGLHLTMAHQFPNQLLDRGENGRRVYNSIMVNAASKVVFQMAHRENLEPLAEWLFMGTMNPDEIKHEQYSTKVLGYREELKETRGESYTSGMSHGRQQGRASGAGMGSTQGLSDGEDTHLGSVSESSFASESESQSESFSESKTVSKSSTPMLVPVLGKELTGVQFRSLEEQIFRGMAVLFNLKDRHSVARLAGENTPVMLTTPNIENAPATKKLIQLYLARCYKKLAFALPGAQAQKQLAERAKTFVEELFKTVADAPMKTKRRIR